MTTYHVINPLKHNRRSYLPGSFIDLPDSIAQPLLAMDDPVIAEIVMPPPSREELLEVLEAIAASDAEIVSELETEPVETGVTLLNLNRASAEELEALPYINLARAQSIVDKRAELGAFTSFDQVPHFRDEHLPMVTL